MCWHALAELWCARTPNHMRSFLSSSRTRRQSLANGCLNFFRLHSVPCTTSSNLSTAQSAVANVQLSYDTSTSRKVKTHDISNSHSDRRHLECWLQYHFDSASVSGTVSPTSTLTPITPKTMASTDTRFFTRLPAELRNAIYELVLSVDEDSSDGHTGDEAVDDEDSNEEESNDENSDDEVIFDEKSFDKDTADITQPFPAVLDTCKQMRAESMSIYLSNRIFRSRVVDCNTRTLIAWLRIFGGFDNEVKRNFRGLHILCAGAVIDVYHNSGCRHHAMYKPHVPEIERWNDLLNCVQSAGIIAQQLNIRSIFTIEHSDLTPFELGKWVGRRAQVPYLFTRFIIPSLLRIHGLYNIHAPPKNVLDALSKDLRLQTPSTPGMPRMMAIRAACACRTPPEFWVEEWATTFAATTATTQASVHDECTWLVQERLHAQHDGVAAGLHGFKEYQDWLQASGDRRPTCSRCADK